MDAVELSQLACQLHNRIGRYVYMVGVKTLPEGTAFIAYVIKGTHVPKRAIPSSYMGLPVEVVRIEPVRPITS